MERKLAKIAIDAELSIKTDSGSVNIVNKNDELNIEISNWDTLNNARKIIPSKYSSLSSLTDINKILFESDIVVNILVKDSRIAQLGKSNKPDIKLTKILGSFF